MNSRHLAAARITKHLFEALMMMVVDVSILSSAAALTMSTKPRVPSMKDVLVSHSNSDAVQMALRYPRVHINMVAGVSRPNLSAVPMS